MSLIPIAALLLVLGLIFLVAEIVLPLHGTSAIGGLAAIVAAVGLSFAHDYHAGLGALTAVVLLVPLVGMWVVRIWPRTPVGRRVVLQAVAPPPKPRSIQVGMTGIAISELKPMGLCDFNGMRVSTRSEYGLIPPGSPVRVVRVVDDLPTVRTDPS